MTIMFGAFLALMYVSTALMIVTVVLTRRPVSADPICQMQLEGMWAGAVGWTIGIAMLTGLMTYEWFSGAFS